MNTRIVLARIISILGHPGVLGSFAIATKLSNTPTSTRKNRRHQYYAASDGTGLGLQCMAGSMWILEPY